MSQTTKTAAFTVFVVIANVAGNSILNFGLKSSQYVVAALGVAVLIAWMLARMTLLSWADLSWVLPVTALGYVLSAVAGQVLFHEQVALSRWAGVVLIAAGAALVAPSERAT